MRISDWSSDVCSSDLASWQLAILSLLVSAVMILSLNRLLVASKRNAKLQTMRLRSLISRLTDALVGLKPMKAMARHGRFNELYMEDLKIIKKEERRNGFAQNNQKEQKETNLDLYMDIRIYFTLTSGHEACKSRVIT